MNEVDLSEALGWETERIRRDAAAVARLVQAALEAPEPQQRAAIARLAQVVARKVPQSICQGLSAQLPALLEHPDAVSRRKEQLACGLLLPLLFKQRVNPLRVHCIWSGPRPDVLITPHRVELSSSLD